MVVASWNNDRVTLCVQARRGKFLYFIVFQFYCVIIHKRVQSICYVSCYYREYLKFLFTLCEVKPCGLRTCLDNKEIADQARLAANSSVVEFSTRARPTLGSLYP